jgi:hypothetical protein
MIENLDTEDNVGSMITSASLNSNSGWRSVVVPHLVSAAVHVWQKTEELGVGSR